MFLQNEMNLAAAATPVPVVDDADTIGSTACQAFFGDDVYDFKAFDEENRDKAHSMASVISASQGNNRIDKSFIYKVCQNEFSLDAKSIDSTNSTITNVIGTANLPSACGNKGNAYIVTSDGTDAKCVNSFKNSRVATWDKKNATSGESDRVGWKMTWTS